ncbi:hypothetical protein NFI96_013583 [Prochilodus magdalenae]|nr:hypothetical protein NFI96_013583 [Prochilodus magdalenae]
MKATVTTGNQCSPDIHSELKDLKTTVAEQKVKLEELQKQLAEDVPRMLRRRIRTTDYVAWKEPGLKLQPLHILVGGSNFRLLQMALHEDDGAITTWGYKPNIAFSASLFGEGGQTVGGHSTEVTLVFRKVFLNTGNAYNTSTGIFTAPVKGVYYFGFSAFANGQNGMGVHLRKNGQQVVATYDYNTNHKDVNGANRAILQLEKGDQVYIGLWSGLNIFDSYNSVSTFSGFLLFLV